MCPRLLPLPEGDRFVPMEQVLMAFIGELFPGMETGDPCVFRVTRDADIALDDDAADDLLLALQEELRRRRFLPVIRLEVDARTSEGPVERLREELGLAPEDVYRFNGPLGLDCLWTIHAVDRPALHDEPWAPLVPPALAGVDRDEDVSIFSVLDRRDVLVHHPYDSFSASVEEFMSEAADDPHVLAIKQCLYRTSGDSPVVASLVRAAERGKQVAVLVEVTARFDEEANIVWARALEEAGAHVIYGLMGLKTHAKTTLGRAAGRQRRPALLPCGHGQLQPEDGPDVRGPGRAVVAGRTRCRRDPVLQLHHRVQPASALPGAGHLAGRDPRLRDRVHQTKRPRRAADGRVVIKVNGLDDPAVIDALYDASAAGVPIDLVIRGICCLRPGVPGLSETIRVRSIVGRFLEHSRIFRFGGSADRPARFYIGSADLRRRNLDRRVEAMIPVDDPDAVGQLGEVLDVNLADDSQAWSLDARRNMEPRPRGQGNCHSGSAGRPGTGTKRPSRRLPAPPLGLAQERQRLGPPP